MDMFNTLCYCYYRFYKYGRTYLVKPSMGRPTYLREFAHMAAIGWTQEDSTIKWNCGGSLIWENYILTAAHCAADSNVFISNKLPDVARFADLHLFNQSDDQYAQQLKIVEIIRHPEHSFRARYHDIALMRLEHKVQVPPSYVRYYGDRTNAVIRRYKNPLWTTGSLYGDVGLLILKDAIEFSRTFYPACIWDRPELEESKFEVSGQGLLELNMMGQRESGNETLEESASSADLPGLPNPAQGSLHEALKPNERETLDDCHLRYYSFGNSGAVAPASGRPAYLREFAHIGAIGWTQPDGSVRWSCGGSLIWENFLLTAAHCAADMNNEPPDVVRFGDLNLFNDTDDQFAQQYKIAEIIRHPGHRFSAKYLDIALIKLNGSVMLNETVAPACLWNDDEIRFGTLEAAGWGATGFGQSQTPLLLKVSLKPVGRDECDRFYRLGDRGLRDGLQDYQLCAGDVEMDTCPGDSGGPLQVKLLHNAKMTPFVVAVTSFGSACGQSNPGVYTKVAGYIPWIRSVISKNAENVEAGEFDVTGRGRFDLNVIPLYDSQEIQSDSRISPLILRSSEQRAVNCSLPKEHKTLLPNGLADEHLCFGYGSFLVPGACEQMLGGAIQRNLFRLSKYFNHVYALNLLGRDCGFGESAVGVRLGSYIEWMSKILLPTRRHAAEPVQFYNTDLELNDHCKRTDASYGMCVVLDRCPRVRYDLDVQRQVTFCGNGTIVCCPFHNVLNSTKLTGTELDECEARYKSLHTKGIYEQFLEEPIEERFPHVVMIAWQKSDGSFDFCIGTLITRSTALSSADCLSRISTNQTVVKLGWEKTAPTLWVKEVILHPRYEESTLRNDIGIVKINGIVDPSTGKLPACIWQNQTHTPFHMRQFVLSELQYLNSYPKYNKDCEVYGHYGNRSLEPTQLCADLELSDYPIESGEPAFWQKQFADGGSVVHYLVGIVSYVFPGMTVQTRVESYVDWISSQL
uniref:Peptidase S1 domain-containing protein n=1 Tax=Anopheles dirus TaxID=7168 RepID=A0A182MYX5_9DIPT